MGRLARFFCGVVLCVAGLGMAPSAFAGYPDLGSAYSACQTAYQQYMGMYPPSGFISVCAYQGPGAFGWAGGGYLISYGGPPYSPFQSFFGSTTTAGDPGPSICAARPAYQTSSVGNLTLCQAGCSYAPAPGKETWTVRGITGGSSSVGFGQMKPTGGTCGAGPTGTTDPLPKPDPIRRLCGGGSCFDSSSGVACAVGGDGQQVCVKVKGAPPGGSCSSGGGTTLCAGNPAPTPPNPPISDPSSQIAASDHYTSQTDDGAISNTTVNNYNNSGANANQGTGTGDVDGKGDKPDDQKKDDGTTASGGGDCKTAPMVEGSAALGMVAMQQWRARCEQPEWTKVSDSDGDQYKVTDTAAGDVFKTDTTGVDGLDQSSWAGNTCPDLGSVEVFGMSFAPDTTLFCRYIEYVRAIVLLLGAVLSGFILASGGGK